MKECHHKRVTAEVCDQTLGVACRDCDTLLAWCWAENHIPESLWNRACENDVGSVPCKENRDDYCGLCGAALHKSVGNEGSNGE